MSDNDSEGEKNFDVDLTEDDDFMLGDLSYLDKMRYRIRNYLLKRGMDYDDDAVEDALKKKLAKDKGAERAMAMLRKEERDKELKEMEDAIARRQQEEEEESDEESDPETKKQKQEGKK
ncbi:UPF0329 protein ECU05_1680/ECU11_0050-like isoform X2 [Salvia splendens]|uniref:UPF0329 protein ECU05_1680/ECU11_0050-like isoform X2 n=1 Tax=Salvia splendens TaxID=180675 RepID=UPI001C26A19F|nr:UPF0329 protein ECU05_1680/ECU11_0050-like isoform X2 [Salvia splendens]